MTDEPPSVRMTGRTLRGKYRIERVLGSGGMGIVVLARHLKLDQLVAVKMLRPEALLRPAVVARFAREARAAARLKNDHVVRIFDVDEDDDGTPFFVMEHLAGHDLEQSTEEHGQLPIERAVDYVLQASEAVAEAHSLGMVHRDLKPANLFVVKKRDGSHLVKLLDFGITKSDEAAVENVSLTSPASVIGSPLYMSPEQLKSSKDVDGRTDIWALGVVLFQLLTGTTPFEGPNASSLAAKIASEPPRSLRDLRKDVPEGLASAIARCLEKDPDDRPATVVDLARSIAPFGLGGAAQAESRVMRVARAAELEPSLAETMPVEQPSDPATSGPRVTETLDEAKSLAKTTGSPSTRSVPPASAAVAEAAAPAAGSPARPRVLPLVLVATAAAVALVFALRSSREPDRANVAPITSDATPAAILPPPVASTSMPEPTASLTAPPPPSASTRPLVAAGTATARPKASATPVASIPPSATPTAPPKDPLHIEIK
jgi:eukaryotic-like serine/threonine-protein kinase